MTRKKDLKKRIRARMEKTGERYTAARAQLRSAQIAEAPDATAEARAEGFRGRAFVSQKLRDVGDLRPLFARLREMMEALGASACGPLFRGEPAPRRIPQMSDLIEARRFLHSRELGMSRNGRFFALSWEGRLVVGAVQLMSGREPVLQLGIPDDRLRTWPDSLALAGLGR